MLCRDKSSAGPSVFNFTAHTIESELMIHLKAGLKNVPVVKIDESQIVKELEEEAIFACRTIFKSEYGYYYYYGYYGYMTLCMIRFCTCTCTEIISRSTPRSYVKKVNLSSLPMFLGGVLDVDGVIL